MGETAGAVLHTFDEEGFREGNDGAVGGEAEHVRAGVERQIHLDGQVVRLEGSAQRLVLRRRRAAVAALPANVSSGWFEGVFSMGCRWGKKGKTSPAGEQVSCARQSAAGSLHNSRQS